MVFPPISGRFWHPARLCSPSRGEWAHGARDVSLSRSPAMPRRSRAEISSPPPVRLVTTASVTELPPSPAHLSEAMQQWWKAVVRDYDLDPHHLRLLEAAADSWDRMCEAREVLREEGLTVTTKHGSKKHPAADIERDSRLAF